MTLSPKRRTRRAGTSEPGKAAELVRICARIAEEKKAEEIVVLNLSGLSYVTDYFLIASGNNPRQMGAIAAAIQEELLALGVKPLGHEGSEQGRWVLLDYGDFVVHLFDPEWRKLYDLELLWGDVPRLSWQEAKSARRKAPVGEAKPT